MAFAIREIEPLTARGATGAARGVFGLRELPREQQSNVAIQAGSGAVEGLARTAALPVDAPSVFGAAADWIGGEGTSRRLGAMADAVAFPAMNAASGLINSGTKVAADALGLTPAQRKNMPQYSPLLSQNYENLQNVAGGDAIIRGLREGGITTSVAPENAAQRYARSIGEFVGGSLIPVGMTLNAAKNAARAGTAGSFLAPVAADPAKFIRSNLAAATAGAVTGEAAYDATGSETARAVGGLLGGFIPGAADAGFRRLMTGGAAGREAIREGTALYNDIGAMPTLGQATAQVPGVGGQVARFLDRTAMAFNPRLYEGRLAEQAAGAERATKNAIASATNDVAAPPAMNLADLLDPVGAIKNPAEYAKRVSEQLGKIGANLEDATGIQQKMMPSDVTAGAAAQAGGKAFKDRFAAAARNEYRELDRMLPSQAPATLDNTLAAFDEILTPVPGAPATSARLASKTIGGWQKALMADIDAAQKSGTAIPYLALKKIRTRVYEALNREGDGLAPSASRAELQRLYSAITDDMRATAQAVGGDAAVAQLERANSIYAQGVRRLEEVFDPLLKADTPEGVFRAIQSADASRLAQFLSSISPEQRASITGRIFAKMGQARNADGILTGSEFDYNTFLTNYKSMSKSRSLEVLFNFHNNPNLGGAGVKQMKAALDKLADMASRARFMERQLYNPSGTAARLTENFMNAGVPLVAGGGLLMGGLSPAAAGGLVALRFLGKAGASALNSPKFLQYLSQTPSITSQKWSAHFSRLAVVAEREGLGPEVSRIAEDLGKRSPEDRLTFGLSMVPGLGGVVATANDVRKYTKGERDLSAENIALTAMNIIPEHAALRGLEDASGAVVRMSDPAMGAVGVAARDPETFFKSLDFSLPKNQGLNIAGGVSEPLARAAGVPMKEGDQPQQPPAEPTEAEKFLAQFGGAQRPASQQSQNQTGQVSRQPQSGMSGGDLLGGRMVNILESALLGGGDELLAFLQSPADEQRKMLGLQNGSGTPTYDRELGTARSLLDQYQAERPVEALATGLAAGIAAPIGAGGAFISRGKGLIGKGARAAAVGAGFGGVTGFGAGRGEDRGQSAADGAFWGSVIGGGLGASVPAVASAMKWIRENPTAFNAASGVLGRDGAAIAKAAGIDPKGMERELNLVFQKSVDIANEIMKDPQGARNLIRRGIDGLAKRGGADVDGNLLLKTIEGVFGDKTSAYNPVWRRVFGEGLNPDKPLGKAVRALIKRKIGPDAKSWQPILTRVLNEVEKRVGPVGPQSRFWNVDEYQPAPIAPKVEPVDDAMRRVTAPPPQRAPAPPTMYSNPLDPEAINKLLVQPVRGLLSGKSAAKAAGLTKARSGGVLSTSSGAPQLARQSQSSLDFIPAGVLDDANAEIDKINRNRTSVYVDDQMGRAGGPDLSPTDYKEWEAAIAAGDEGAAEAIVARNAPGLFQPLKTVADLDIAPHSVQAKVFESVIKSQKIPFRAVFADSGSRYYIVTTKNGEQIKVRFADHGKTSLTRDQPDINVASDGMGSHSFVDALKAIGPPSPPSVYSLGNQSLESRGAKPIFSAYKALRPYAMDAWARARGTRSMPAWVSQPVAERKGVAAQMREGGAKPKEIWRKTGMYMHSDGRWRTEIGKAGGYDQFDKDVLPLISGADIEIKPGASVPGDDALDIYAFASSDEARNNVKQKMREALKQADTPEERAKIVKAIKDAFKKLKARRNDLFTTRLSDAVSAPQVFGAFPEIGESHVQALRWMDRFRGTQGAYMPKDAAPQVSRAGARRLDQGFFQLAANEINDRFELDAGPFQQSTLRHEMQHAVQDRFGDFKEPELGYKSFKEYLSKPYELEARLVQERADQSDVVRWHYPPDYEAKLRRDLHELEGRGFFSTVGAAGLGGVGGLGVTLPLWEQMAYEQDAEYQKLWHKSFDFAPIDYYRYHLGLRVERVPGARPVMKPKPQSNPSPSDRLGPVAANGAQR